MHPNPSSPSRVSVSAQATGESTWLKPKRLPIPEALLRTTPADWVDGNFAAHDGQVADESRETNNEWLAEVEGDAALVKRDDQNEASNSEPTNRSIRNVKKKALIIPVASDDLHPIRVEGPAWRLTLAESIQVGLANSKDIAVIAPDPAIKGAVVSFERGEFDPVLGVSAWGGHDDRLVRSQVENFGSPLSFQNLDNFGPLNGRNSTYFKQNLVSGGAYEIGFGTAYRAYDPVGPLLLLPSGWESSLNFQFVQPLMRGRGLDVSQRRIRIASARRRQSEYEFRSKVRESVRDIDLAYWYLAGAYRMRHAAAGMVRMATQLHEQETERESRGLSALPQLLQTRALLRDFRILEAEAIRQADVAEMKLRQRLGLAQLFYGMDGCSSTSHNSLHDLPIAPISETLQHITKADLDAAVAQAMTRPELSVVQAKIDEARAELAAARNQSLPDVKAHASYSKVGLDKNLDSSVSTLFDDRYHTWGAGVTFERRLKQRSEKAAVRQYSLAIQQEQARQNQVAHDIVANLRSLAASVEGYNKTLQERMELVQLLIDQQEALDELYEDEQASLFQRLENIRAIQVAKFELIENWALLNLAQARWRFERGDDASRYGIEIQGHGI